jgi:hypothetical protein
MPSIIVNILRSPPTYRFIALPGTVEGLVYKLAPPLFAPQIVLPLEFDAIGSGHQSTIELKRSADWIMGGQPGNDFIESMALTSAVEQFIVDNNIIDVGGMYPSLKVDQRGVLFLGASHSFPLYDVSLHYDIQRKRWRQENLTTGKTVDLLYPWEILADSIKTDMTFNDMREALQDFRSVPTDSR